MLLVGASVTMLCSVLLKLGINHISYLERELERWMEQHQFNSVRELQGQMNRQRSADPSAFERAHYIRTLQSYKPAGFGAALPPGNSGKRG
jgi:dihydroorotate dehydrogenase (fumarate)